jgi:magnesium transporter
METIRFRNLQWIFIEQTSYRDVEFLEEHYPFHPLDLKDCIGVTQRPKIDIYEDYIFLVFHFPQYDREQQRIRIQELNVFVGADYIITLTNEPIPALADYFREYGKKVDRSPEPNELQNSSGYLLYKILDCLFTSSFPIVDILGERLSSAEEEVFNESKKNAAVELSFVRRNILIYQRLLEPQLHVIDRLVQLRKSFLKPELSVYFDDVHDGLERTWSILNTYKDILQGLDRTNEAISSQRLNDLIRTLTVISVITIIPTMMINIYSMNIKLPFASHPKIFYILTALFFIIMFITYSVLHRRRRLS